MLSSRLPLFSSAGGCVEIQERTHRSVISDEDVAVFAPILLFGDPVPIHQLTVRWWTTSLQSWTHSVMIVDASLLEIRLTDD